MKQQQNIKSQSNYLGLFLWLLFAGLFYLYYPQIQNYSATPKWIFVSILSFGMLLFGKKAKIPWSSGLTTWFLFVLLYLIQSYWSFNFWDAVVRTIPLILAPLIVVFLYREANDIKEFYSKVATVLAVLISPILLITLVEILGLISAGEYSHLSTYQFRFTFGNRNQYAELLVLIVPLLAIGFFSAKEKTKRILFIATIALIYITATLLLNRASILVLYTVYPLFVVVLLLLKVKMKTRKLVYGLLIFSILGGLLLVASPLRKEIPVVRNLLETRYGSGSERVQIWGNSIHLWKESPVFGKGSGDWKIEILKTPLGFTKAEESTVFFQRAHNDFIQIAVENGIVGLLLFVGFLVLGIVLLLKSEVEKETKIVLCAGVAGYVLLSNFSFPIEKIELLILMFLFFVPGLKKRGEAAKKFNIEKLSLGFLIFGIFLLSVSWIKNERKYFEFKAEGDQLAFSEINKDFYTIDPTTTPIYWHEGNTLYNQKDFESALTAYEKALKYNPNHAHVLNNIASCYYGLGDMKEAENFYKKALTINPRFVESLMNYSSFLYNRGEIDAALNNILLIPNHKEPVNYPMYIHAIAKAKYKMMMELNKDTPFENFLTKTYDDDAFLYEISRMARNSGECYEIELRNYIEINSRK